MYEYLIVWFLFWINLVLFVRNEVYKAQPHHNRGLVGHIELIYSVNINK
jgi:hypothetical protein